MDAAKAMLRKLRLPEHAAPDAQPGRDLPAFRMGALHNPQLLRYIQARSSLECVQQASGMLVQSPVHAHATVQRVLCDRSEDAQVLAMQLGSCGPLLSELVIDNAAVGSLARPSYRPVEISRFGRFNLNNCRELWGM